MGMAEHRRDKTARVTSGAPPRIRVARREDGSLDLSPMQPAEGVRPETVAAERPPRDDDPRPAMWRDVGGPYST
jgi:hypothetical protein